MAQTVARAVASHKDDGVTQGRWCHSRTMVSLKDDGVRSCDWVTTNLPPLPAAQSDCRAVEHPIEENPAIRNVQRDRCRQVRVIDPIHRNCTDEL